MTLSAENPYSPPLAPLGLSPGVEVSRLYNDAGFLAVRTDVELPRVCLVTNEPDGPDAWRKCVTWTWYPSWVFILILVNILVMLIVALACQKKATETHSFSARVRARIVRRRWVGGGLLLLTTALIFVGAFTELSIAGLAFMGAVLALIGALGMFIIANPLKVVKQKEGWFRVKGCSPDFLASLPPAPAGVLPW